MHVDVASMWAAPPLHGSAFLHTITHPPPSSSLPSAAALVKGSPSYPEEWAGTVQPGCSAGHRDGKRMAV